MESRWQDKVFSFGGLAFIVALVPSLLGDMKPDLMTSLLTGSVLMVFTVTYGTMGFWWSTLVTGITSLCWFALAFQQIL